MTYPQQYPPQQPQGYYGTAPQPQQQYAPAPPQYAPQGYPGAVVTYPPAPQQQSAPPQQQYGTPTPPPATPELREGGASGGSVAPKARHLVGRTVIVEPVRMQRGINQETKAEVDEAVFHLTVVDGGPLRYGDNQSRDVSKNRPNTHEIDTPCRFTGVSDMGMGFVQVVKEMLDTGEPGRIGVIEQGTMGNKPFLLARTGQHIDKTDRPDGQARFAAASAIWQQVWADKHAAPGAPKQFISPEPRSLVAPPAPQGAPQGQPYGGYAPPAPVNYGAPAQPPQQQYAPQPPPYGDNPAGYYAANAYAAQQVAPQPPQPPAYGGIPAQPYGAPMSAPPAAPAPVPAPAPSVSQLDQHRATLPPPVAAWLSSFPAGPEQDAQVQAYLAHQAQQGGAQPQPAGPGM